MKRAAATSIASIGSFAIYAIPLIGPHALVLVGEDIVRTFGHGDRAWAWMDLGAAAVMQAVAWGLLYWSLRTRRLVPIIATALFAGAALVTSQFVYMLWLPARFLIDVDAAPEIGSWREVCGVARASVDTLRAPRIMPPDGWQEAWLTDSDGRHWVLRMPECRQTPAALPEPHVQSGGRVDFTIGIAQIVPGGRALVQQQDVNSDVIRWSMLTDSSGTLIPVTSPSGTRTVAPFLADDGTATGWILPIEHSGPPQLSVLRVQPIAPGHQETTIDLSRYGPDTYEILSLDAEHGALLYRDLARRLIAIGPDGLDRAAPAIPPGVEPQSHTVLLAPHGVVAWDAYREDGPYAIAWAMDRGAGLRRIKRGSSIIAASVDPSGEYVGVTTSTTLNIGRVRDTIVVFRATDGAEVFRRYLPTYSRTNVVFLGSDYFVYSDAGGAHVIRMSANGL